MPPRNMPVLFTGGAHRGELQKAGVRQTRTKGNGKRGKADKDGTASADRGDKKLHRLKC